MKIKAQLVMVMNLDKCIGRHTCSIPCKHVWINREGV
jgi:nitrate reductase beta subunit